MIGFIFTTLPLLFISFSAAKFVPELHPAWPKVNSPNCGIGSSKRIIGGTYADIGQFPWLIRLGIRRNERGRISTKFSCGGSLITPSHVLTAAHCDLTKMLNIARAGEYDTKTEISCRGGVCAGPTQDRKILTKMSHGLYRMSTSLHDINLVKVESPFVLSAFINTVCLPSSFIMAQDMTGMSGQTAGWGIENIQTRANSRVLKVIEVPILSSRDCVKRFKKLYPIFSTQICAGGEIGEDSCGGDSGGPLMVQFSGKDKIMRSYAVGIISFGMVACGATDTPAVFTNVSMYMDWILNNIDD